MRHRWGPKDGNGIQTCLRGCRVFRSNSWNGGPRYQHEEWVWSWHKECPDCLPPVQRTEKPEEASK